MALLTILLQAATSAPAVADTTNLAAMEQDASTQQLRLFDLLMSGGSLMIPLLICSIILVYVFVERFLAIRKATVTDPSFMGRIKDQVEGGNIPAAISACKSSNNALSRVIEKGVSRIGKPIEQIEKSMENTGKLEVYKLEKNLSILTTIAGIAPMLGFLGTIAGMIILFFNVQHQGFDINSIAGGIYTKMVTSATGLIIGLLAYVGYTYLNAQINKQVNRIESASVEFLDFVQDIKQ
ncbi:MAG: MotA/TolQ/ExbB proton channel family protein [Flavipsychrobacter sp.]|jgi:biopolymer transport protein ExbB|nr:MotA/TolQ/ExbB proton channel family protein [Flavipsychrobacter sp.]